MNDERIYDNTHKKNFSVPKIPWHTDDHKFGESSEPKITCDGEDVKDWKKFDPPMIDPVLRDMTEEYTRLHTISIVDSGKCRYCHERAVYAHMGYLYCATCWMAEDNGEVSKEDV